MASFNVNCRFYLRRNGVLIASGVCSGSKSFPLSVPNDGGDYVLSFSVDGANGTQRGIVVTRSMLLINLKR